MKSKYQSGDLILSHSFQLSLIVKVEKPGIYLTVNGMFISDADIRTKLQTIIISAESIIQLGGLEELDYKKGFNPLPSANKIYYTAMSEDGVDWLEVGIRFANRFGVYIGDDLGFPKGTQFNF